MPYSRPCVTIIIQNNRSNNSNHNKVKVINSQTFLIFSLTVFDSNETRPAQIIRVNFIECGYGDKLAKAECEEAIFKINPVCELQSKTQTVSKQNQKLAMHCKWWRFLKFLNRTK